MRRRAGMTFVELIVCLVILGYLAMLAIPASENATRRVRELDASACLREIRRAIDRYQDDRLRTMSQGDVVEAFPKSLDQLVDEHYLRKIPVDPLTGAVDWLSITDGSHLLDVRTRARGVTLEGIDYADL